ncbi:MAG: hypothetical protein FWH14_03050 [Oscillospiraceae bacterium]|nr:hypothetical protein [Oscillospiraceae bacterium]
MKKLVLKKVFSVVLAVAMLATCIVGGFVFVSSEEDTVNIVVETKNFLPEQLTVEQDITLEITLPDYESISTFSFRLVYDSEQMQLKSAANGNIFSSFLSPVRVGDEEPIMNFSVGTGDPRVFGSPATTGRLLATLTFTLLEIPEPGESIDVTLVPHDEEGSVQNMIPHPVVPGMSLAVNLPFEVASGAVAIYPKTISGIEIYSDPDVLRYEVGHTGGLNLTGGRVVISYENGYLPSDPVSIGSGSTPATGFTILPEVIDFSVTGSQEITVSYEGFSTSFRITIGGNPGKVTNGGNGKPGVADYNIIAFLAGGYSNAEVEEIFPASLPIIFDNAKATSGTTVGIADYNVVAFLAGGYSVDDVKLIFPTYNIIVDEDLW